jgi:hypothetical protein
MTGGGKDNAEEGALWWTFRLSRMSSGVSEPENFTFDMNHYNPVGIWTKQSCDAQFRLQCPARSRGVSLRAAR